MVIFDLDKKMLKKFLEKFDDVPFAVDFKGKDSFTIGSGEPVFTVHVNKEISKAEIMRSTSLALGEAYMNKDLELDGDLFAALNIAMSQLDKFAVDKKALDKLIHTSTKKSNQKKEVSSHYDIGNDFYKLWLDETLSYSCGYFKNESDSLYDAQVNKVHHILSKLNLKEGMSLLDIGCGWGYLLIEAAKKYKIHGLGITLSEEQAKEFQHRIEAEGLQDYLEVKLMDYRDLKSSKLTFDRVVSVGMLEHVGRANYNLFMECVNKVLKQEGLFLLHFIGCRKETAGDPWIKKYIFPGGTLPSLREIIDISYDYNNYTLDVESLRCHYAKTLLCWYNNFQNKKDEVRKMFDEPFVRMWELYLCSCAASFNVGMIDLHQILFSKGATNCLPLTREYMYK
ncbi:SAM-dependent methyltransferase [Anaerovorax odorimutans]|uniref:SAM-dependent methyltransferase n=1 Tax=Anaerovorax odorimutans TaxID=109327 RepID=UPI000401C017|nr:cyclopropane-fatty-acyl-phospholipid synthase family protein [Anaerovorax odorimutans]